MIIKVFGKYVLHEHARRESVINFVIVINIYNLNMTNEIDIAEV